MAEAGAVFVLQHCRAALDPPELMIRMRLIGYCFGIRSERRLCEEVHLNLAYTAGSAVWVWGEMATCPTIRSANRSASGEETRLPRNGVGTLRLSGRSETRRCQPPRSVRSDSSWRARSGMASRRWAGGNRLGSSRKFLASSPSILQVADCVRNDDASAHATPAGARLGFSSRADARSDDRSISARSKA